MSTSVPTSTEQRLTLLVRQALGNLVQQVDLTYDAQAGSIAMTGTIGGRVPLTAAAVGAAQQLVKQLCFRTQQALWAGKDASSTLKVALRSVSVTILGPALDDYSTLITAAYGTAVLEEGTAQRLSWASLNAESAWAAYDQKWLRQSFVPAWL